MKSRLVIKIDAQLHKELKIACIENDQTLTDFVVKALKKSLEPKEYKLINSRVQSCR